MTKILVAPSGNARAIYDDALIGILESVGNLVVRRASHVEPLDGGGWGVSMAPCGGGLLGPYRTRCEALAEEIKWLETHDVPVPSER